MQLYAWFPFTISHGPARCGDHRPYRRRDILFLLCHVTLFDHMVGGCGSIMGEFPSLQGTIWPSLVVTSVVEEDIGFFLDYHVISNDFVVKESRNIMREFPSS